MTFVATENKGFGMTFDNGFTISVQWGTFNYCEKKNLGADIDEERKTKHLIIVKISKLLIAPFKTGI